MVLGSSPRRLISNTSDFVNDFINNRRQGLSTRTIQFYRDTLSKAVGVEFTQQGINTWLTNLKCKNAKLNHYRSMKALCNWLFKSKKINSNPIAEVDKPKTSKRILPAITESQLKTLVSCAANDRNRCILHLLFDSGIRLSEIAGIKDSDFNWVDGVVTVIGKGNKQRQTPFTDNTSTKLKQWFSVHETFELKPSGIQNMLELLGKNPG